MSEPLSREWYAERGEHSPEHLGDGVYASWDGYHVWLRTPRENGIHEIALEPATMKALIEYVKCVPSD